MNGTVMKKAGVEASQEPSFFGPEPACHANRGLNRQLALEG
jgi:hypothetical protein